MRLSFCLVVASLSTVLSTNVRLLPRTKSAPKSHPLATPPLSRTASSGSSPGSIPEALRVNKPSRPRSESPLSLGEAGPSRRVSLDKDERLANHHEQLASLERSFYHLTANDFQKKYGAAYNNYRIDRKDPNIPPEKLYQTRRNADIMIKSVGAAQKDLANAYAKASHFASRAGRDDRAVRNDKKAQATAAHFYATQATYRASKDVSRMEHLPEIADVVRQRGGPGSAFKAGRIEASAQRAADRLPVNQYVMHQTTKSWRKLRNNDGRDTESEDSEASQEL